MKIVFLSDDFPPQSFGGAGISTYELALGVKKAGNEVSVITTCRKESDAGEFDYNGLKIFKIANSYPARWRGYLSLYNPGAVRKVEEFLKKIKPDVVHANNIHHYLSYHSLKVAKRHARVVIITLRDVMSFNFGKLRTKRYLENFDAHVTWLDQFKQAKKRWNPFRNFIIRRYLKYPDKILAVSNALKDALLQNSIKNVEVIHTGVEVSDWKVSENELIKFKSTHKSFLGKRIVFFGGRLSEAKGGRIFEEVMKRVKEKYPEAKGVSFGGIGDKLSNWVSKDEMRMAYALSGVVLVPSVCFDSLPRIVLEAQAAGRPVISTPYGGAKEVIVDGVTGYIVNPFNMIEMSEKIIDLLKNSEKAENFGKAGKERIQRFFNLEDKIQSLLTFYK